MRPLVWVPSQSNSCLYKKERDRGMYIPREKPCEASARRWASASQGKKPQKKPTPSLAWPQTSTPQNYEKISSCCWSHPLGGILLPQLSRPTRRIHRWPCFWRAPKIFMGSQNRDPCHEARHLPSRLRSESDPEPGMVLELLEVHFGTTIKNCQLASVSSSFSEATAIPLHLFAQKSDKFLIKNSGHSSEQIGVHTPHQVGGWAFQRTKGLTRLGQTRAATSYHWSSAHSHRCIAEHGIWSKLDILMWL